MKKLNTLLLIYANSLLLNANDIRDEIAKNKAITIKSTPSIIEAKNIANKLSKYDIYIYKTKTNTPPLYVLYAVNIKKSNRYIALGNILKVSVDSYLTSQKRINLISKNSFNENIFIKKDINTKTYNYYYNYIAKLNSNIRQKPNNNSKIVGVLFKNQKIFVNSTSDNWHKTKLGYIFHNLLKKNTPKKVFKKIKPYNKFASLKSSFYKKIKKYIPKTKKANIKKSNINKPKILFKSIQENLDHEKYFKNETISKKTYLKPTKTIDYKKYFLGLSYAYNNFNNKEKDNVDSLNANIGINLTKNYSLYFNHNKYDFNNIDVNSYYMSLDYNFEHKIKPFFGISLGSNTINHNDGSSKNDTFLYGIQSGFNYKLKNALHLLIKVSYFKLDYDKNLLLDKHKSSLEIGLRYYF